MSRVLLALTVFAFCSASARASVVTETGAKLEKDMESVAPEKITLDPTDNLNFSFDTDKMAKQISMIQKNSAFVAKYLKGTVSNEDLVAIVRVMVLNEQYYSSHILEMENIPEISPRLADILKIIDHFPFKKDDKITPQLVNQTRWAIALSLHDDKCGNDPKGRTDCD